MPEVCALVYMLLVERLDAYQVAAFTAACVAAAMGGGEVEAPDPDEMRAQFDEALCAEPRQVDPRAAAVRRVLGLREVV